MIIVKLINNNTLSNSLTLTRKFLQDLHRNWKNDPKSLEVQDFGLSNFLSVKHILLYMVL